MDKLNLLITGIGGQGIIAASDIVSEVALAASLDVKKTDSLGMAQRGGSVVSHIRFAPKVFSPLIKTGETDILLSFEKLEASRWSHYLKPGGIAIVNDYAIPPPSVSLGKERYPDNTVITDILKQHTDKIYFINGTAIAEELGNIKVINTIMLGCLSVFVPFDSNIWRGCISGRLPLKVVELNFSAFERGKVEMERMINTRTEA